MFVAAFFMCHVGEPNVFLSMLLLSSMYLWIAAIYYSFIITRHMLLCEWTIQINKGITHKIIDSYKRILDRLSLTLPNIAHLSYISLSLSPISSEIQYKPIQPPIIR